MEVICQPYAPFALCFAKELQMHIEKEASWGSAPPAWSHGRSETSCFPDRNRTLIRPSSTS
jgi:hypothetical protein